MNLILILLILAINFQFAVALTCDEKIAKLSIKRSQTDFSTWKIRKSAVKFISDVAFEYQLYGFRNIMNCNYDVMNQKTEGIYIYDSKNVEHYCPPIFIPYYGVDMNFPLPSPIIAANHTIIYDVVVGKYAAIYTCFFDTKGQINDNGLIFFIDAKWKLEDLIGELRKVNNF